MQPKMIGKKVFLYHTDKAVYNTAKICNIFVYTGLKFVSMIARKSVCSTPQEMNSTNHECSTTHSL